MLPVPDLAAQRTQKLQRTISDMSSRRAPSSSASTLVSAHGGQQEPAAASSGTLRRIKGELNVLISSEEYDLDIKLRVSRFATALDVTLLAVKRLQQLFKSYAPPMSEEEATVRFALFTMREGGPLQLHRDREIVAFYGVRDEDMLRLERRNHDLVTLKIQVPMVNQTVGFRADRDMPISMINQKLCARFYLNDLKNLELYRLFLEEKSGEKYTMLQEGYLLSSFTVSDSSKLLFRPWCGDAGHSLTLSLSFPDETRARAKKEMSFNPLMTVADMLAKITKLTDIEEPDALELYYNDTLLAYDTPLSTYAIPENETVQVRRRFRTWHVQMPDQSLDTLKFDRNSAVSSALSLLRYNYPLLPELSEFGLFVLDDEIDPLSLLWSHSNSSPLTFAKHKNLLLIRYHGDTQEFAIDYGIPLSSDAIDAICLRFGQLRSESDIFSLFFPSVEGEGEGEEVNIGVSLLEGQVPYGATLIMKLETRDGGLLTGSEFEEDERVNIWDEPEGPEYITYEKDGSVSAGTLNKLIALLAAENIDVNYPKAFFLTFESFTTPGLLFTKLLERYSVPSTIPAPAAATIQLRVCNALKMWVDKFHASLTAPVLRAMLEFAETRLLKDGHQSSGTALKSSILKRAYGLNTIKDKRRRSTVTRPGLSYVLDLLQHDDLFIAQQITAYDWTVYSALAPAELLTQAWVKPSTQHISPNVVKLTSRFNQIGLWVARQIIEPPSLKARIKRFERFISIAKHLRSLNNYNSLMAFVGGMNNAAVQRLKFTRQGINKKLELALQELEKLMKSEGAFRAYREALRASNPPLIPFVGVYLQDVIFIDEGNPNRIENLINFAKRQMLYRVISEVLMFQDSQYTSLKQDPAIAKFLEDIPVVDEKAIYNVSLSREPRDCNKEDIIK